MIAGIVAIDLGQGIGFNGQMPWPFLKEDMRWFKQLTQGHVVIMGSTTWSSLPKKLDNRVNAVISKNSWAGSDHVYLEPVIAIKSLADLYPDKNIFIIGGQQLYDSTFDIAEKYFVTSIEQKYTCDKHFDLSKVNERFKTVIEHFSVPATDITPKFTCKEFKNEAISGSTE
jgi:dihydrofolate reductase